MYVAFVIEDTWHYFAHRLLHHPKLYKHVHKFHHTVPAPFTTVLNYSSVIEMTCEPLYLVYRDRQQIDRLTVKQTERWLYGQTDEQTTNHQLNELALYTIDIAPI